MFRIANDILLDEANLTTTDVRSEIIDITNTHGLSLQATSTGTVSGTVYLEVSNDGVNFASFPSISLTVTNAATVVAQFPELFFKYGRVFYDATSGTTNTLKVHFTSKSL